MQNRTTTTVDISIHHQWSLAAASAGDHFIFKENENEKITLSINWKNTHCSMLREGHPV